MMEQPPVRLGCNIRSTFHFASRGAFIERESCLLRDRGIGVGKIKLPVYSTLKKAQSSSFSISIAPNFFISCVVADTELNERVSEDTGQLLLPCLHSEVSYSSPVSRMALLTLFGVA